MRRMSQLDVHTPETKNLTLDQALSLLSHQQEALQSQQATLQSQQQTIDQLQHQLDWFKKQLFGEKSERRLVENPAQIPLTLDGKTPGVPREAEEEKDTITYQRGKAKKRRDEDCVNDHGLRFGPDVPMETIELPVPDVDASTGEAFEVIEWETTYRLAQRPSSYIVVCYKRPIVKNIVTGLIAHTDSPGSIFERSVADVSFLAGMLVEKFQFHLPLYRQHQRLEAAGIKLSRATLTNLVRRSIALLEPIYDAQLANILASRVLAMDETPIKAGKSKARKGRMHTGYYWPVFGEENEIAFVYAEGRAHSQVKKIIGEDFKGTIVSDGYAAYAQYAAARDAVTNAQCWSHSRRKFIEAENDEPEKVDYVLALIKLLYAHEATIRDWELQDEAKLKHRLKHSKSVVDTIFIWVDEEIQRPDLLPKSPFAKALGYLHKRQAELRVFLGDPDVPLDTNHVERSIRKIAMSRNAWLFCWTELGATQVGIIQSLISSCILHQINPYDYLVDVLQRVQIHPNTHIKELTPLHWKNQFANNPLRSDIFWNSKSDK